MTFLTLIRRHPTPAYFALTFAISWGGALVAIGGSGSMLGTTPTSDPRFAYAVMAMLAGPSLTGILLTGLLSGRTALREFVSRLLRWRVSAGWYGVALLTAPVLMTATLLALSLASSAFVPGIFISSQKTSLLLVSLAVGGSAGVFEELGWTGFAIPALRRRRGVLATGLIVGIWWSAWHLFPNLWSSRAAAGELPMVLHLTGIAVGIFVGYLTAFRILMVWVYDHTQSVLIAILMHVSLTASLLVLNPLGIAGAHLAAYSFALAAVLWLVVASVAVTDRLLKRPGKTPPFRRPDGEAVAGSIAEVDYLRLGGVEQWVMIRGERAVNPPLILLHGGPGFSETHFFRRFNAPLEAVFTVVYWDQRGAGKSFDRNTPAASMTGEQFIADLDELVEFVRKRLGHEKVVLFGHSWGSALGALYALRFPQKIAVYIGCEQVGDWRAAEDASYMFAIAEAERRHDAKALKELRAIGRPPYSARSLLVERMWLSRFDGQMSLRALWKMGRDFLGCPESSMLDLPNVVRGFRFSLNAMWADVSTLNLRQRAPALQIPVFFFVGRRDRWIPPETSVAYFEALIAPSKQLVWFDESGHEPFVDEADKFNRTMLGVVRPAVDAVLAGQLRRAG